MIKTANNLIPEECDRHPSVLAIRSRWNSNSSIFRKITKEETALSLKNLNTNKAIGFDMIPSHALKIAAQEPADSLTKIFYQCITERTWQNIWKKEEWIPVFKREDPLEKTNYRPITVLTVVDKIFEQLLSKQTSKYFVTIFDPFMSAYRKI